MGFLFYRQGVHFLGFTLLFIGLMKLTRIPGFRDGESTAAWFMSAVVAAALHAVYVLFCWRLELMDRRLSRALGPWAFPSYMAGFVLLLVARPVTVCGLAIANSGSLPLPPRVTWPIATALAIPVVYLGYSVVRHFGVARAAGLDHFDASVRRLPLVRAGIFRWTPNAMYVFGFLLLWIPGLVWSSIAALAVAAFSHALIWLHYYCTEKPDLDCLRFPSEGGP